MIKPKTIVIVILALIAIIGGQALYYSHKVNNLNTAIVHLQASKDSTSTLVDSSRVRIANLVVDKDTLHDALVAQRELNGHLIAAVRLYLHQDSVSKSDTTGTKFADSTRSLEVHDTTADGILNALIVAPPMPAQLRLHWTYIPAPIDATVSLVQMKDNEAIFAVKYRGGSTTLSAPYAKIPAPEKTFVSYGEALYNVFDKSFTVRAGEQIKIPFVHNIYLLGEAEQRLVSNGGSVYLGTRILF